MLARCFQISISMKHACMHVIDHVTHDTHVLRMQMELIMEGGMLDFFPQGFTAATPKVLACSIHAHVFSEYALSGRSFCISCGQGNEK